MYRKKILKLENRKDIWSNYMNNNNIFERVEQKYQLSNSTKAAFLETASKYIHMDEYGLHTIHNIYYDTDHYDLVRTSLQKPKYKEKFRVRSYGALTEEKPLFLEIKKKYEGIVYKRRTQLPYPDARAFLDEGIMPHRPDQVMKEINYFFSFYHPKPKLYLAYDRTAYVGNEDSSLRITIDANIRSSSQQPVFEKDVNCTLLNPDCFIMEIKVLGAYPLWLSHCLSDLGIYPVSFSKYGTIYTHSLTETQ